MTRVQVLAAVAASLFATVQGAPAKAAEAATPPAVFERPAGPSVSVVEASIREISDALIVTGTLVPRERILVGVDIEGLKIRELLVDQGDTVAAGDVLARLSTDLVEIQLAQNTSQLARVDAAIAQAESQIAEARAAAVEAAAGLDRTRTLAERGVVSEDQLERRVSAADSAKARVAMAERGVEVARADKTLIEAQRREIELRLSKTEIRAPAAGLVLARNAFVGSVASAQGGALFEIARDGLIELDAEVPETMLPRIADGQTVEVLPAGTAVPVTGTVRLISPQVDMATRLGRVRIALPADAGLRAGSFARGTVEVARTSAIAVPVAAVVAAGGQPTVQVVVDGRVESRAVETGLSAGGFIEIVSGLEVGDTIVSRAGTFLRDGDPVTPVSATTIVGENG